MIFPALAGALVLAAAVPSVGSVAGRRQTGDGAVEGRVISEVGAPLASASVRLAPAEGAGERQTESDRSGGFRIGFLHPGRYLLTVRRIGYRPSEPLLVDVVAGAPLRLSVVMQPVPVALDSLVVSAPRVSVSRETAEFPAGLTARELAILPTFNEARTLVAFVPGARPDQIWGGASAQANLYQLDGVRISHPGLGGDFLQPSVSWVEELEVRGLGAGAETGDFQGGIVNYVTKSGGNRHQGQLRLTGESHQLNGSNLSPREVGGELGRRVEIDGQARGPVVRDRLHYAGFAQFIGREQRQTNLVPQQASDLVEPAPGFDERKLLGKLTWRPGSGHVLTGSLGRLDLDGDPAGLTGFESPEAGTRQRFRTLIYSASWRYAPWTSGGLEARLGGYRSRDTRDPLGGHDLPSVQTLEDVDPLAYQNAPFRESRRPTSFDLVLTGARRINLAGASHELTVGGEVQFGGWDYSRLRTGGMTWRPFNRRQPPGWDPGLPSTWVSQGVIASSWGGETRLESSVTNSAVFLQDHVDLTSWLRISPGLRMGWWTGRLTPSGSGASFTAVQDHAIDPRIGVVVDLDRRGTFVAKAHWGRYHQGMFAAFFDRVEGADVFSDEQQWNYRGPPFGDPHARFSQAERDQLAAQGLFELVKTVSLSETGPAEGYRQPYVDQVVAGLEKTFGDAWKAQALFLRRRNRNMVALVDRNLGSNWTEFRDVVMQDRFFRSLFFGGEPLVLDRLWISNKDIIYWWTLLKSGVVQGEGYLPPGMSGAQADALTYDPDYVLTTVPEAKRELDQLQLMLEARYPTWWASGSATISRLEGNLNVVTGPDDYTSGGAGPWVRPNEQINFEGRLNNQSRLEVKLQAGGLLPWGFRAGAFATYYQGDRVTPTLTMNPLLLEMAIQEPGQTVLTPFRWWFLLSQAGHRVFVRPRGSYRYPSRTSLDLHLERSVPVRRGELVFSLDGFNVLASDALTEIQTSINGVLSALSGASEYGQPRGRVAPRTLRLGAGYRF